MEEEDRYTRITLRIPKDLHTKLQASADSTSKSMNAEIIARLQSSFIAEAEFSMSSGLGSAIKLSREELTKMIKDASKSAADEVYRLALADGLLRQDKTKK